MRIRRGTTNNSSVNITFVLQSVGELKMSSLGLSQQHRKFVTSNVCVINNVLKKQNSEHCGDLDIVTQIF